MLHVADGKVHELETLSQLFLHLESASVSAPRLVTVRGMLAGHTASASRAIRSLQRLSERHGWGHRLPLVPVGLFFYGVSAAAWAIDASLVAASALLLFGPFLALTVERWRRSHGRHVGTWIAALAEFEATIALATYHFEHPQDPFPVIEGEGPQPTAMFDGVSLGHPLLSLRQDGAKRRETDVWYATTRRKRLEHVRKEHVATQRRRQRRACAGRCAGARCFAAHFAARDRRDAAHPEFASARGARDSSPRLRESDGWRISPSARCRAV